MTQNLAHYEVAIIGGGLAGLTLSIQLARQGRKVILFEKETYPFHKVCGEYIAMESWDFLSDLGIPLANLQLPRINQLHLSAPNGNHILHNLKPGGFGISRFTLDHLLSEKAIQAGVVLHTNCKVTQVNFALNQFTLQTSLGIFTADYAFGTYGKRSNIDLQLKRNFTQTKTQGSANYIGVKYHIHIDQKENVIGLHNFENGYCGISKIDLDRYCLCYLTTAANLKASGNNLQEMENNLVLRNPHLKRIWLQASFIFKEPLTISQIRFEPKTQIENHVMMLGDAAGLIAPLCGNGMSMAMHASKIVAQLLPNNPSKRKDFEIAYEKAWRKNFGIRIMAGRNFQALFGSTQITNIVIGTLKTFPFLLTPLISLTHGKKY